MALVRWLLYVLVCSTGGWMVNYIILYDYNKRLQAAINAHARNARIAMGLLDENPRDGG